jgi:hypothetical protein
MSTPASELAAVAQRMEAQRAQLHQQFAPPPVQVAAPAPGTTALAPMQPFVPRSLLMKLLMANPQLLQRLLMLFATGVLGSRLSPWLLRVLRLWVATRKL